MGMGSSDGKYYNEEDSFHFEEFSGSRTENTPVGGYRGTQNNAPVTSVEAPTGIVDKVYHNDYHKGLDSFVDRWNALDGEKAKPLDELHDNEMFARDANILDRRNRKDEIGIKDIPGILKLQNEMYNQRNQWEQDDPAYKKHREKLEADIPVEDYNYLNVGRTVI